MCRLCEALYLLQFSLCVHGKTANLPIQFSDNHFSSLFKFKAYRYSMCDKRLKSFRSFHLSLSCYIVNQIYLLFLQLIYSYCYSSYYRLALLVYEMAQRGGGQEESQEVWAG